MLLHVAIVYALVTGLAKDVIDIVRQPIETKTNYHTAMGNAAFPREALRRGIERGNARIQFMLTADGRVTHVESVHASNPVFAHASEAIFAKCRGQGRDVVVRVPFDYRVE